MFKLILNIILSLTLVNSVFTLEMTNELIPGIYKLTESDNFDNFLKEFGVNIVIRKIITLSDVTDEIKIDGDNWSIKTTSGIISGFMKRELNFKLNEPFVEEREDKVKVNTTFTLDGNVLTQKQKGGKSDVTYTRTFNEDGFILKCEVNDVVSIRKYIRQK